MKTVGEYLVYKKDVCEVVGIKNMRNQDYYSLIPMSDASLKITIPVDNPEIRDVISKEEMETLLKKIPTIHRIDLDEGRDRMIENEYKYLLQSNRLEDLVKIIKTTYARNQNRIDHNKKISEKDDIYFKRAEEYLYNEFSVVLGLSFLETKQYVVDWLDKAIN